MSDPQPDRLKPRPRRAEPLQPDKPGSGDGQQNPQTQAQEREQAAAAKSLEQAQTALENTRKGYD